MATTDPELAPEYEPRRAEPGTTFGYTAAGGEQREIVADDEGVVWPKSGEEVGILDGFDLPVARKALAETKEGLAEAAPDDKKPEHSRKPATDAGGKG